MNGRPARHIVSSFIVLLAVQLLTSVVAITLFVRMSPAIRHILEDNVVTFEATEQMLVALTRANESDTDTRQSFRDGLERAKQNVTEAEETQPLATLTANAEAALDGQPDARRAAVEALVELGRINREAAQRADATAHRLGSGGAWAAALLGLIGMGISLYSLDGARKRVLAPVTELSQVAEQYQAGNLHRRCTPMPMASEETHQVMLMVNRMLDETEARSIARRRSPPRE